MDLLVNAFVQVVLFTLIPLIWWLVTARSRTGLLVWVGLKKPKVKNITSFWTVFAAGLVLIHIVSLLITPQFVDGSVIAASQFAGQGWKAVIPAFIYAFVQTGLSEEIFFRGYLGKRLMDQLGFRMGNLVQGLVFGLVHGVMFFSVTDAVCLFLIVLLTGWAGWLMGLLNERYADGSILPGWLLHSLANSAAALMAAFN
jgi:membrane protease YdiL (CAAX protease family)